MSGTTTVLDVRDLTVSVPGGNGRVEAVRGVSFELRPGQRLGLVGESGSGKSLTAYALMGLLRPPVRVERGSVLLDGVDLCTLGRRQLDRIRGDEIAMIYQDPMSSLNPVRTVGWQLVEALRLHTNLAGKAAYDRAVELLDEVGIVDPRRRIDAYPHQLSGGMRQRVMIAMALSCEPRVIVADEPTTALDVTTQARVMALMDGVVAEHGVATILITHDLGLAAQHCDEIQVMYAGALVERSPVDELFARPRHPYSQALLASVCDLETDVDAAIPSISGHPPDPGSRPSGCPFHPRCPLAFEVCDQEEPTLQPIGDQVVACHAVRASVERSGA